MNEQSLSDRMKSYENDPALAMDSPESVMVLRLDGKAFHTYTRGSDKPFDEHLGRSMRMAMLAVSYEIQGFVMGYTQSDEVSILCARSRPEAEMYFGAKTQKAVSVVASMYTHYFNHYIQEPNWIKVPAFFDCRAFELPSFVEADNYLLWRQFDCQTNAINSVASYHFTPKQLHSKSQAERIQMISDIGDDVDNYNPLFYNGATCIGNSRILNVQHGQLFSKVMSSQPEFMVDA